MEGKEKERERERDRESERERAREKRGGDRAISISTYSIKLMLCKKKMEYKNYQKQVITISCFLYNDTSTNCILKEKLKITHKELL